MITACIRYLLVLILLICEGIRDYRTGKIALWTVLVSACCGIFLQFVTKGLSPGGILGGALIGVALLGIGFVSEGSIGYGDGLVFLATGIILGFGDNFAMLMFSLLFCAIFSAGLLVFKKAGRKSRLPFIPFTVPGLLVTACIGLSKGV